MTDENRQRLFLFLSMAVVLGWYMFVTPHPKKTAKPASAAPVAETAEATPVVPGADATGTTTTEVSTPESAPEKIITIETPLYTAKVSTFGGVLKSFQLKDYQSDERDGPKELVTSASTNPPLSARIEGLPAAENADRLAYAYDGPEAFALDDQKGQAALKLTYRDPTGVEVIKQIAFAAKNYGIKADYRITGGEPSRKYRPVFVTGLDNALLPKTNTSRMGTHALVAADSVDRHEFKDLSDKEIKISEEAQFVGFEDHYFLTAIIPENPKYTTLNASTSGGSLWEIRTIGPEILAGTDAASAEVSGATFYLGPKYEAALVTVDPVLESAINYGFAQTIVKPIARFLLGLLRIFHGVVGDWGYAILLLTVLVRIVLFPLAIKQYHSMQAMAMLKPKMEELKAKFGEDKLALNQATMELFREYKVNPLSGCLPILPQIPIFLGLYVSLDTSLELRHAVFTGTWIHDLSIHDPYYILPIVTCVTMAISMKLTPSQADPMQQKIMMIMPVVMFFLFMKIAAGLVLYWSASNIFSIAQQLYFNRKTKSLNASSPKGPPKVVETTATEVGKKKLRT